MRDNCALPSQYAIDYESLLSTALAGNGTNAAQFLREERLSVLLHSALRSQHYKVEEPSRCNSKRIRIPR